MEPPVIENGLFLRGSVKFFDTIKGFGFISQDNGGDDVFFHITGVKGLTEAGAVVEYNIGTNKNGPIAINVQTV